MKGLIAIMFAVMIAIVTLQTPKVEAGSYDDIQAQIAALMEQLNNLQALLEARTQAFPPIKLTRNLAVGMSGVDVRDLQRFLNADPETMVAASGPGSRGHETMYFGPATQAAVIKFQNKYREDILTPVGLQYGTGFVGPRTIAKINQLISENAGGGVTQTGSNNNHSGSQTSEVAKEGDITVTRGGEHTTTLELGTIDDIYSVDIKAHDSDMVINRVDFMFDLKPWRYIESFELYLSDKKIASLDAVESNFKEDGDEYRLRFSGLNGVIGEDQKETLVLKAKTVKNLSRAHENDALTVYIPERGIRATDSARLTSYGPSHDLTSRTFDFRSTENDGSLVVTRSADSPRTGLIEVSTKHNTDEKVLTVKVKAKANDIDLDKAYVKVDSSALDTSDVVRRLSLVVDGKTIQSVSVKKNTGSDITGIDEDGNTYVIIASGEYYAYFDDISDVTIAEDTRKDIDFVAELGRVEKDYPSNTTVVFTLRHLAGENESDEDVINGDLTVGSNKTLTLTKSGIEHAVIDTDAYVSGINNDIGNYSISFDVTAFGDDIYLPRSTERYMGTTTSGSAGVEYSLRTNKGAVYTLGSTYGSLTIHGADREDGFFRLNEGESYTVTLETILDNTGGKDGAYRLQIEAINYRINDTTGEQVSLNSDFTDYETKSLYVNN